MDFNIFKKKKYLDYQTYKAHIDFLDDIWYRERMARRAKV